MRGKMKKEKDENVILCGLCGGEIESPKGLRRGQLSSEQSMGAHESCRREEGDIMRKHSVNPNIEFQAQIMGLLKLHPEVEQTESVFNYRNREDEANEELYKKFPYFKKKVDEAEAKKVAEKAKEKADAAKKIREKKKVKEI